MKAMNRIGGLAVCLAVACSDEIGPDPSGSGAGTQNGSGGAGGGAQTGGGDVGGSSATGGAAPGGGFESGGRLKARTLVGSDGARSPAGWFDSALAVECQWGKSSDGQTRCLPSNFQVAAYYADAACTVPVLLTSCGSPTHVYVPTDSCGTGYRVFPITGSYSGAYHQRIDASSCFQLGTTTGALTTGAEMAPEAFVAATVEIEQ